MAMRDLVPVQELERRIFLIRGHRVMIDHDLADLYGVPTKVLNQAVRRNRERFPDDFIFRLTKSERAEVDTICDHLQKIKSHDHQIEAIFDALRELINPPESPRKSIGFQPKG